MASSVESAPQHGRWIDEWEPEDPRFWETRGRRVATRNLIFSIFTEHLGFSVWILMSVVVVSLPQAGITLSVSQTFWLLIVPNLVGAALRIPYTFAIPRFGGRGFTTFSALILLVPTGMLAVAVTIPDPPYWFFLATAAAMGLGGGNFSSSMANISFFFPTSKKGFALGLNAAGGNLGVAVTQFAVPLAISAGTGINLVNAALMWMPVIILAAACAWWFMDSLTSAKSDGESYAEAMREGQTWIMSVLYIGTFGSFIGFSFAFPTLLKALSDGRSSWVGAAFTGALIGSVSRPLGGWLADRMGGAKVTITVFGCMAACTYTTITGLAAKSVPVFFASSVALFILAGIGNGSTYRMIPLIFSAAVGTGSEPGRLDEAMKAARRKAAAAVGIAGSVGAFGGVAVNLVFKSSLESGSLQPALWSFLGFYIVCCALTWWCYLRKTVAIEWSPSLAYANV
ncbi:MFS transporter [Actinokineospora xionganensis]|uniref:NarK/NasA family nitrate transporter n=1 Tax=Actinokineospora xionganensis TaxID=2684470 RepID=A0ABR7L8C7_9PSEU|nr:nitrate/nitrite transporter [Actinokineospora xionganensis]MBC6448654.1 NarK/NasA family nitrate transporter [Actinokineospora xionganensis]